LRGVFWYVAIGRLIQPPFFFRIDRKKNRRQDALPASG
jgi:hypothetical protein